VSEIGDHSDEGGEAPCLAHLFEEPEPRAGEDDDAADD